MTNGKIKIYTSPKGKPTGALLNHVCVLLRKIIFDLLVDYYLLSGLLFIWFYLRIIETLFYQRIVNHTNITLVANEWLKITKTQSVFSN